MPLWNGDELKAMPPVAGEGEGLFQRRHGDAAVNAKLIAGLKPGAGVPGGDQVNVTIDDRAVDFWPGNRPAKVDAQAVVVRWWGAGFAG